MGPSLTSPPAQQLGATRSLRHRLLRVVSMVRYRFFLYAGLLPYLLGAAWAYAIAGTLDVAMFWSGLGGVVLAVIGVEAFNDYFDSRMGTDRVFNPEDVPLVSDGVFWLGVVAFAGALAVGVYLTVRGGWPILAFALARRRGGDLLRGAADPLVVSRPGRGRDRAVVRPVDGAGQPLPAHAAAVLGRVLGVAAARAARSWRWPWSTRFPISTRTAWSASATSSCGWAASARFGSISRSRRQVCWSRRSAWRPAPFPWRASPRCSRCRCSSPAAAAQSARSMRRDNSCRRCAAWSAATSWRSACSSAACCCRLARLRMNRIDSCKAPLLVSWQITRDCDLCCLHCCTESAPGKRLPDELDAEESMRLADDIIRNEVPYVMLCGGEPLVVPHFLPLAEALGDRGRPAQDRNQRPAVRCGRSPSASRDSPIRSVQISLDADSEEVYQRQRPGGSLAKAHAACRAARDAGLPLEVTFAPTRLNIDEAAARHRASPRARRVPFQYRQADAHRHRRAPVGQARARRRRNIERFCDVLERQAGST